MPLLNPLFISALRRADELAIKLRERGFDVKPDILTIDEAKSEILRVLRGKGKC